MGGSKTELDLRVLQQKRLCIYGTTLRSRSLPEKRLVTRRFVERWLPLLAQGRLKPVVDSVFPMNKVQDAHRAMEANQNFGKIILEID